MIKDKKTKQLTMVDETLLKEEPKGLVLIEKTNKDGTKTITTNNIAEIVKVDAKVTSVLENIRTTNSSLIFDTIETIQYTNGTRSDEYTFITLNKITKQ